MLGASAMALHEVVYVLNLDARKALLKAVVAPLSSLRLIAPLATANHAIPLSGSIIAQ